MIDPVSVHTVIARPPEAVWAYLTVGELLARWFADSTGRGQSPGCARCERGDLAPRRSFLFEFGDGDYFVGAVTEWSEARVLGLQWRFMGIGPMFDIRLELARCEIGTGVTVTDRGASSMSEAESLHAGWTDFLARLDTCICTGRITRYEWSETISAAALTRQDAERIAAMLRQQAWWLARFPDAELLVSRLPAGVAVDFRDPAWRGASTRAEVTIESHTGGACVQVRHEGWTGLPQEMQLAERRRVAGLWASTLARLEAHASG